MRAAEGILTARGGMTSHAALVARGWGKCCIVGAGELTIDVAREDACSVGGRTFREGDVITLNGTRGHVYAGELAMMDATENPRFAAVHEARATSIRTLGVRTNADTPEDAAKAREFGAEGIGLFRTEHMFYGEGSDEPLFLLRKMILSARPRRSGARPLDELFPLRQEATSRRRWRRWTACRSPSACSTRRCTSSCRTSTDEREKLAEALGITPGGARQARPTACTRPTR